MAGLSPNSANISRTKRATQTSAHLVVHPEYDYWRPDWAKIRDALAGEREIKRKGTVYLRALKGQDKDAYASYLDRAVFYNMTAQTLNGMVGQVFRRPPTIRKLPTTLGVVAIGADGAQEIISPAEDKFSPQLRRFAKDGSPHQVFAKTACSEQIALGRFGALVDTSSDTKGGLSYVVGYTAENIVDWTIEDIMGVYMPTRILLREFERVDERATPSQLNPWIGREGNQTNNVRRAGGQRDQRAVDELLANARPTRYTSNYMYRTIYRELTLEPTEIEGDYVYKQYVYVEDPLSQARDVFTPMIRGNTLNFIPFVFFGAGSNTAETEKPPLLDIADLNIKHYRTYAELEHGRFYTALPVYYAPGNDDEKESAYHIGPNVVWEVPPGEAPGIIEFKGEGLKTLERALNEKEQQIAAIGGRMMPGASKSVSESDNQVTMREANEQSLLLNVIMALEEGMSMLVRYWLMFRDVPLEESALLRYEIDSTFLAQMADSRTLRVIQQLYEAGILEVNALYENLVKNGLESASTTLEEFKARIANPNSFIGQPDVTAMRNGYANRAQELEQSRIAREISLAQQKLDLEERRIRVEEQKLEIAAAVDSTSVSATRQLGDPEQAAAPQAVKGQLEVQNKQAETAAKAQKTAAAKPAATPTSSSPKTNR